MNATVEVTDDDGEIVLEFPFAEALLDAPDDQSATRHDRNDFAAQSVMFSDCASAGKYRKLRLRKATGAGIMRARDRN